MPKMPASSMRVLNALRTALPLLTDPGDILFAEALLALPAAYRLAVDVLDETELSPMSREHLSSVFRSTVLGVAPTPAARDAFQHLLGALDALTRSPGESGPAGVNDPLDGRKRSDFAAAFREGLRASRDAFSGRDEALEVARRLSEDITVASGGRIEADMSLCVPCSADVAEVKAQVRVRQKGGEWQRLYTLETSLTGYPVVLSGNTFATTCADRYSLELAIADDLSTFSRGAMFARLMGDQ